MERLRQALEEALEHATVKTTNGEPATINLTINVESIHLTIVTPPYRAEDLEDDNPNKSSA